MKYGYICRDFPVEPMKQLRAIEKYVVDDIFSENDYLNGQKQLHTLFDKLQPNDEVFVYSLRVLGLKLRALAEMVELFKSKNIRLVSVQENIDTNEDKTFYDHVILLNQIDKLHSSYLTKKGIEEAKEKGRIGGRPKISPEKIQHMLVLRKKYKYSFRKISEDCGVSLGTVYKYIKDHEALK